MCADTTAILIDLILAASSIGYSISDAITTLEVITEDADALTEDIVIDLIVGTVDLDRNGSIGWWYVVSGLCANID